MLSDVLLILFGFGLGLVGNQFSDWRRARARREELATALVFEIRRAYKNLEELEKAISNKRVIFTSDFGEELFIGAQIDIAVLGGDTFLPTSAFYAQLRQVNFLRGRFLKFFPEQAGYTSTDKEHQGLIGEALATCVRLALENGDQALEALKQHAKDSAYTATLPPRRYTEEERTAMGFEEQGDG